MTEKNAKINLFDRTTGFSPLSDTLGQLTRPIQALNFMDIQPITNWSTAKAQGIEDQLQQVADDYEAMDPDLDVNVYYGSSPSLEDTVRSAFSKDRNLFANLLSVPVDVVTAAMRADHFDPLKKSVSLFNPSPEILRHELGHALDMKKTYMDSKALNYIARAAASNLGIFGQPIILGDEFRATKNGLESMGPDADPSRYLKMTGGGFGSYMGGALGSLIGYLASKKMINASPKTLNPWINSAPLLGSLGGAGLGYLTGSILNSYRNPKIEEPPTTKVLPEPASETPEAVNDIPEVKAASFRSSLPLFKQAEREANAAMMKELQAEGNMEPAIAGMDPEEIDPEVAAAINEILMQLGAEQASVDDEEVEQTDSSEKETDDNHTVEKASSLLPLFERINVYGR